jgi:glycosyltransferase involved in cell wall biosynthesis
MSRLLMLAPTPVAAAATRFRVEQFRPALRDAGIESFLSPFLDSEGWGVLYQSGWGLSKLKAAVRSVGRRLGDMVRATRADAVFIHREAALVGPPLLEWFFAQYLDRPVVFDLDDPIWIAYESPTYGRVLSQLLKAPAKTNFTLRAARQVIAGNPYVAHYARQFNDAVDVVPTVVDTTQFRPLRKSNPVPVLGWVGTHSTVPYLSAIVPALQRVARDHEFILRVVGGELLAPGVRLDQRRWSLEREVRDFQELDVGLYPLRNDRWSVGKSGFKAIQYMACGVPVVASPVGVTREIVEHGETGFFADGEDAWVESLSRLLTDIGLRRRLGEAARGEAESRWSLKAHSPRFVQLVTRAMSAR